MTAEMIAKALADIESEPHGWRAARLTPTEHRAWRSATATTEIASALPRGMSPAVGNRGPAIARPWQQNCARERSSADRPQRKVPDRTTADDTRRNEVALAIRQAAKPCAGTLVEDYLSARGLHLPPSTALRFHPGLYYSAAGIFPAMVALVTDGVNDTPIGITEPSLPMTVEPKPRSCRRR